MVFGFEWVLSTTLWFCPLGGVSSRFHSRHPTCGTCSQVHSHLCPMWARTPRPVRTLALWLLLPSLSAPRKAISSHTHPWTFSESRCFSPLPARGQPTVPVASVDSRRLCALHLLPAPPTCAFWLQHFFLPRCFGLGFCPQGTLCDDPNSLQHVCNILSALITQCCNYLLLLCPWRAPKRMNGQFWSIKE